MTTTADDAFAALGTLLGERLNRSQSDRDLHGRSESHFNDMPPDAVVYPETTDEVAAIVRICAAAGLPLIGWGAGTSLEGHALAPRGGVTVDFNRMNRVLDIAPEDMVVTVQPGVTREQLNTELRSTGLFFPIDPGANASLGGMTSTRASGTTAVRYGTMRANVLALEVVLADGRVIRTGTRAPKSSTGYDLTALFVGAEGTLGLITEVTLKLHGQPEAVRAAVCAFDSMAGAVDAVIATIQSGIPMARIEFVDAAAAAAFNRAASTGWPNAPHLMVEFHGSTQGVEEQVRRFAEIASEFGAQDFRWAAKAEERTALWAMRHNAYRFTLQAFPGSDPVTTDICVPISRLAEAVEETAAEIAASGIPGPIVGHVGDGNFHALLLPRAGDAAEWATAQRLAGNMAERALRLGGTVSGEHGIGLGKTKYMRKEHGDGWDVMGAIKAALDPDGLMNPGKLLPGN
ncbi:MAG TPA: FAD-linked oxidase C-terminal domain-containing protein [Pararhodobacter sp.]|uniref:FAD-binding oxidoreductase n=1 Tax=Pararhodobacter sp. TaxID=2127056 RepID=UPI002B77E043|nr:FAD-linked oxidase C-terminal domain-containing protein [Pararhodobacter sp.]HPD93691.1 FAD-linked oxidase C-terminal domain-containing protein [Pararhodobacter sp.]